MRTHLAILMAVAAPVPVASQTPAATTVIDSGTTVRLHLLSGARVPGVLLSPVAADTALFRLCPYPGPPCAVGDGRSFEWPSDSVAAVQRRAGHHGITGMAIGLLAGIGIGVGIVKVSETIEEGEATSESKTRVVGLSAVLGGAIGYITGAGADRWVAVPR